MLSQKQEGYQLKDLFDYVGIDWQPSKEMQQKVAGKSLLEGLLSGQFNEATFAEDFGYNYVK